MEREAYSAMARIEERHWWFVARRKILKTLISDRIRPPADARILEAGCGTGGNLQMLQQFGKLEAFEFDALARDFASQRDYVSVVPGHLPDGIGHIAGPFDMIALLDVLEHIDDDVASLRALGERLGGTGKLLITVPALGFLWSQHDVAHHHHRRYSRSGLRDVIGRAGLRIEYISYFNSILLPLAIVQRLVSRLRTRRQNLDAIPAAPLNAMLEHVFATERVILKHTSMPLGLSLCAICSLAPD